MMISSRAVWIAPALFFTFAFAPASASEIDALLKTAHVAAGVQTTDLCDDATFIRRLSLDLIGRVPTTNELTSFLADPDRTVAVDRLLQSSEHARFWSHLWTSMLVGRGQQQGVEPEILRLWMEQQLVDNVSIDQVAFDLITAQGVSSLHGPANYIVAAREDPVMRLSRIFLSVQLDCAQCHDHPHDRWTNDDYLAMKRFFQPTQFRQVSGGVAASDSGGNPNGELPVFLTGRKPHTGAWRRELGLMVVQSKPFSRAMVNRTWHWLMGKGLVDPVDGLSRDNPAAVPELLETLAAEFRSSGFQAHALIRQICLSQAYQRKPLTSYSSENELQLQLFAARNVRTMLPEQWLVSLSVVLDRPIPDPQNIAQQTQQLLGLSRQAMPSSDPFDWNSTTQTLIRQLSGEIPVPLRDLDSIFLATLARLPTVEERRLIQDHPSQETLYALVHCNEFMMND